jgi:hypothetical protein
LLVVVVVLMLMGLGVAQEAQEAIGQEQDYLLTLEPHIQ